MNRGEGNRLLMLIRFSERRESYWAFITCQQWKIFSVIPVTAVPSRHHYPGFAGEAEGLGRLICLPASSRAGPSSVALDPKPFPPYHLPPHLACLPVKQSRENGQVTITETARQWQGCTVNPRATSFH